MQHLADCHEVYHNISDSVSSGFSLTLCCFVLFFDMLSCPLCVARDIKAKVSLSVCV